MSTIERPELFLKEQTLVENPQAVCDWIFASVAKEYEEVCAYGYQETLTSKIHEEEITRVLDVLGIANNQKEARFRQGSFVDEGMKLQRTQRLFGLSQHSPAVSLVFPEINLTRGQHTEDIIELSARILTKLAVCQPDEFDRMLEGYDIQARKEELNDIEDRDLVKRTKTIMYLLEYCRLHDIYTAVFHSSLAVVAGYDENIALLEHLTLDQEDSETLEFYTKYGINRDVLAEIAKDTVEGSDKLPSLIRGRKAGERVMVSADFASYCARDVIGIASRIGGNPERSFTQRLHSVFSGLIGVSEALAQASEYQEETGISPLEFEDFISPESIYIDEQGRIIFGKPQEVYNLILTHAMLRLFFTGSPWYRGVRYEIGERLRGMNLEGDLLEKLQIMTDGEALKMDKFASFSDVSTVQRWTTTSQATEITWGEFEFKDVGDTLVKIEDEVKTAREAFPVLFGIITELKQYTEENPLYLVQQ